MILEGYISRATWDDPGKTTHIVPKHSDLPKGPLANGFNPAASFPSFFALIMVCMFSHWVEALLCRQTTSLAVLKIALEKIIPIWGIPSELHSS